MFSYLVTFHMNNGHIYKTVLIEKTLEEVKEKVNDMLQERNPFAHFHLKDNKNVQFSVVYENISVIEFELLSAESILEFEELIQLKEEDIKLILSKVSNDFVIGIALLHAEPLFVDKCYACLPERRKQVISNIIKLELGKIKMTDVLQAQNEVLGVVEKLVEKGEIMIDGKDEIE